MPKIRVFRPKYFEVENNACFFIYIVRFLAEIFRVRNGRLFSPLIATQARYTTSPTDDVFSSKLIFHGACDYGLLPRRYLALRRAMRAFSAATLRAASSFSDGAT